MTISSEAKQEVERLLRNGQKNEAVTYLCDTFQISAEDGKLLVEAVEAEIQPAGQALSTGAGSTTTLQGDMKSEVERLLRENLKIEAVKYVRHQTQAGLREALILVEEVEQEINPNAKPSRIGSGCLKFLLKGISVIFALVTIFLLLAAGIIYYMDSQIIKNGNRVNGRVVRLVSEGDTFAPVIAYTLNGKDYEHQSTYYSNPSEYTVNEQVWLFVSGEKPDEILIDSFSDRWLAIMVMGGVAIFFGFFSFIMGIASRRF